MKFQCEFYYYGSCYTGFTYGMNNFVNSSTETGASFIGKHVEGKTNDDVKTLFIYDMPLKKFPRNLCESFPKMTTLQIQRCGLEKISREDLVGLENLEFLNLVENKLTSLPDDLFADMKKLHTIHFDFNALERLSSNLLKPIDFLLIQASFLMNRKINECFDKIDPHRNDLTRLKRAMDSLKPPLPETHPQPVPQIFQDVDRLQQMNRKFTEFKVLGEFTDATLKVRGKEYKVHKNILAALSPVFREKFAKDETVTEKALSKVKHFSDASFERFLEFFYSGEIGEEANALEIIELATVFEVSTLKLICTEKISTCLSPSNALEVFNLGHDHKSDRLKNEAFKVIQKIIPEVPDCVVDNQDQVNKLFEAKRDFDAILEATKSFKVTN